MQVNLMQKSADDIATDDALEHLIRSMLQVFMRHLVGNDVRCPNCSR